MVNDPELIQSQQYFDQFVFIHLERLGNLPKLPIVLGAILLGVVVIKLFLIDLSTIGTVERIVSFIVVGLLMLVLGYFSPLPPAAEEQT